MELFTIIVAGLFLIGIAIFIISILLILISVYIRNDVLNPVAIASMLIVSSTMIMISIIGIATLGLFIYIDKLI